jgi:hypothetical protein
MTASPIAAQQPAAPEGAGQSERDSSRLRAFHTGFAVHPG